MAQKINNKCVIFDFDSTLTVVNASSYVASSSKHANVSLNPSGSQIFNTYSNMGMGYTNFAKKIAKNPDMILIDKNFTEVLHSSLSSANSKINVFGPKYEIPELLIKGTTNKDNLKLYAEEFFGGKERIKEIKNMFSQIKKNGYTLIMSSKGIPIIVSILLRLIDCFNDFDLMQVGDVLYTNKKYSFNSSTMVSTQFSEEGLYTYPTSKSEFMRSLMKRGYTTMIYVDDYSDEFTKLQEKLNNYIQCYKYHNLSLCQYVIDDRLGAFVFVGTLVKESSGINEFEINIINWLVNAPSFIKQVSVYL